MTAEPPPRPSASGPPPGTVQGPAGVAAERAAFADDAETQAELRDLRASDREWRSRQSTRILLQLGVAAEIVVPPGTVRRQAAGYWRSAAAMALGATAHVAHVAATPLLMGHRARVHATAAGGRTTAEAPPAAVGSGSGPPSVSVIVPVYNAARADGRYLVAALESVAAQDSPPLELIVVDDGSTDDSAGIVEAFIAAHRDFSVRFVRKANGGQSSARNRGAELAEGDWLAFLDQDDIWPPTHLRTVVPHLADGVDLVYTDADIIDENDVVVRPGIHARYGMGGRHPKTCIEDVLYEDICAMPGVTTIRRSTFTRIGGFDERLSGCEDDDLFVRAIVSGRVVYVPAPTLCWRLYAQSYGQSHRMIDSRLVYWRKLVHDHADGGRDALRVRRISLRFLSVFLGECSRRLADDGPLAREYLAAAMQVLPALGPVDRASFSLVSWAFRRRSRSAALARIWFLNGLEPARPRPVDPAAAWDPSR